MPNTIVRIDRSLDLAQRVRNFLRNQAHPDADQLIVDAQGDVVTVRGRVASESARQLAASCCQRVAGVRRVVNETEVGSPEV